MMHMQFKEIIKRNPLIRRLGKKVNILRAYYHDVKDFNGYYNESAEVQNEFSYSIMLLVHSLEKGMCMKEIRPYGFQKVNKLKNFLRKTADVSAFEYQLGVAVLEAWVRLFRENNWTDYQEYKDTEAFIADKHSELLAGRKLYEPNSTNFKSYFDFIASRHSVREFQEAEISEKDVEIALECFNINFPLAGYRQEVNLSLKPGVMEQIIYLTEQTRRCIAKHEFFAAAWMKFFDAEFLYQYVEGANQYWKMELDHNSLFKICGLNKEVNTIRLHIARIVELVEKMFGKVMEAK